MKNVVTRKAFQEWLRQNWNETIGVQNQGDRCAIAQFVIHKIPNAKPDIGGEENNTYYLEDRERYYRLPQRKWIDSVIETFDNLDVKGSPTGADLLKAMGWGHRK